MGYFTGLVRAGGGWGRRAAWRYGTLIAKARSPQGSIVTQMENRNGVDWVKVQRISGPNTTILYEGPVAGPKFKTTHNRPVKDGHFAAVRDTLGIEEWKMGCGNCAHAPDGWGSGCNRPDHSVPCGGWRWPKYGNRRFYPSWTPRLPSTPSSGE